jgi:surface protein
MTTIINNDNIRELIASYIFNKSELPDDLKDIPIGRWNVINVTHMDSLFEFDDLDDEEEEAYKLFNESLDGWNVSSVTTMSSMFFGCINFNQPLNSWNVSNVKDMSYMFSGCTNFNQPLNGWDVSNVTDMSGMSNMFYGCINFNQPLDSWDVSSVTNMNEMFKDCTNFNQPLNGWNVSSVTEMSNIFEGCNISQENKPRFIQPVEVDALQVHKEASKINYAKLNSFLKEKLNNVVVPEGLNYGAFINESLTNLINESGDTEETKIQQRNDLGRIMDERLSGLDYQERSILVRESIFYTLNYVLTQPNPFKQMYSQTFIQDCIYAYEGEYGMTCANGALERIVFSLVPACATEKTNPDYETIIAIITANPSILIPVYIKDWYMLHKTGTLDAFPPGTSEEEMKSNLKSYLLEKLPNESVLINQKIVEYADVIGYDEESFMYGGKRRRLNKRKTHKRKTYKRKTYKRKTHKRKTFKRKTHKRKTHKRKTKIIKNYN